jgi:short-subunit dehydrogenase
MGERALDNALIAQAARRRIPPVTLQPHQFSEASQPFAAAGCHAVVTGAAEGIGRALAAALGEKGYAITGLDINSDSGIQVQQAMAARGLPVTFLTGDLGKVVDVARLAGELVAGADIDVLVHNAGINHVAPFAGSDLVRQKAVLDINLRAPLQLTAALLRDNKIKQGGTLIFVSSLSRFAGYPGATVYAASKDGLASYARSLAVALAPQGIHVVVVYPGPTRTAHARRYSPDNRREHRRMPPEQVAAAIVHAIAHRRRTVIPGLGNRLVAVLGRWAPGPVERSMKRAIYDRLPKP